MKAQASGAAWAREVGLHLRYSASLEKLAALRAPFVELQVDPGTDAYLLEARARRHGRFKTFLHRLLRGLWSDFDINGLLGTYPMHVLSTAQWETLLGERPGGKLLDIGAGRGDVSAELAKLFDQTTASETSRPMIRRLKARGFTTIYGDITTLPLGDARFDAVSLLNVLDRCDRPLSLLGKARSLLRPSGHLLIALVLPYRPFVYDAGSPRSPLERLPISRDEFEYAVLEFIENALLPLGLNVTAVSRTPYLSGGDAEKPLYELDNLIVVCRAQGEVHLLGS